MNEFHDDHEDYERHFAYLPAKVARAELKAWAH